MMHYHPFTYHGYKLAESYFGPTLYLYDEFFRAHFLGYEPMVLDTFFFILNTNIKVGNVLVKPHEL